jgi:hypothetical protein
MSSGLGGVSKTDYGNNEIELEYVENNNNKKKSDIEDELNEKVEPFKKTTELFLEAVVKENCKPFNMITDNYIPRIRNTIRSCLKNGGLWNELKARVITVIALPFLSAVRVVFHRVVILLIFLRPLFHELKDQKDVEHEQKELSNIRDREWKLLCAGFRAFFIGGFSPNAALRNDQAYWAGGIIKN